MINGEKIVRKERSGNVGPIGGQKADEYTEKYEYIAKAVLASEEINRGAPCTPKRISDITTGQTVVEDMSPSKLKKGLLHQFQDQIRGCKKQR